MARKQSTNETDYWLIPKRANIHQVWCLIDGIKARNANGRAWNPTLQNDLGVNLKRWGATNDGRNISPQAMRTLNAYAQYLGFTYLDTTTTPTVIRITKAGELFWENCKPYIQQLKNLIVDEKKSLQTAEDVKFQLEKLQLTNPIEKSKCTNVLLFPFRITLKLLLDLEYLDHEELAMYVFGMKEEAEYTFIKTQIENFRKLPLSSRRNLVEAFKQTTLGQLSLVKAPSSGYYTTICEKTGIIYKSSEEVSNSGKKISTIRLQDGAGKYAQEILNQKYAGVLPYDFGDDLRLWIEYFGNPNRTETPINAVVINQTKATLLVTVQDPSQYALVTKLLQPDEAIDFGAFIGDTYKIRLFSSTQKQQLKDIHFTPTKDQHYLYLGTNVTDVKKIETVEEISAKITEHINASYFAGEMAQTLRTLKLQANIDRESDSMLRGAYLESLFYELLHLLEKAGKVSKVVWNGRYNELGLPSPAPGGKNGTPDILFDVKGTTFVLELTTMKAKSMQEKAECVSVPDHIRLVTLESNQPVKGIFAAPIIHERITNLMKATAQHNNNNLGCITIPNLLKLFQVDTDTQLYSNLMSI